jgi:chromosome segregation ATPase
MDQQYEQLKAFLEETRVQRSERNYRDFTFDMNSMNQYIQKINEQLNARSRELHLVGEEIRHKNEELEKAKQQYKEANEVIDDALTYGPPSKRIKLELHPQLQDENNVSCLPRFGAT